MVKKKRINYNLFSLTFWFFPFHFCNIQRQREQNDKVLRVIMLEEDLNKIEMNEC